MPLTVNTNVASLAAQRSMLSTNSALETSFERLATGKQSIQLLTTQPVWL